MAKLTVLDCSREGAVLGLAGAAAASAGGDEWPNTGREVLIVTNTDADPHDVSVAVQAEPDGKEVTERLVTVAAGTSKVLGPYPVNEYSDSDGLGQITYSAVTGMKVQAVKIPTA